MAQRIFIIIIILTTGMLCKQQVAAQHRVPGGYAVMAKVIDGDTIPQVNLRAVYVLPPLKFKNARERRRYYRLVYHVKKVYPYSQVVKRKMQEINDDLGEIENRSRERKYLKSAEEELRAEFEGELRKLTFKQGRILIKLINRETGETTYEIVKELKGGLTAFFWQSVAVMFHSSLKYEYDPTEEDRMIEDIVIRIEAGQL